MTDSSLRECALRVVNHWRPGDVDDAYRVCRDWLTDHPSDDDEPVTEEWLELNATAYHGPIRQYSFGNISSLRVLFWPSHELRYESGWFVEAGPEMKPIADQRTRGDVRRLCRALGIELKE